MPIEITKLSVDATDEAVESLLADKDGKPTIQAEVLREFVDGVDFDSIFEDEDVRQCVETEEGYAVYDKELDVYVEAEKGDEGAVPVEIESLSGEALAEAVDLDDLATMFDWYMTNEHANESIEDKIRMAVFGYGNVEEAELLEKKGGFAKGDFRKIRKAGGADKVNRMLGAMMNKESIKRASAPGKGYRGGDYTKAAGYAPGTSAGLKRWRAFVGKNKAKLLKKTKEVAKKKVTVGGKTLGGAQAIKKAAAKAGAAKVQAMKKIAAKAGAAKKSKKGLVSSTETEPANLSEGVSLAVKMTRGGNPLTESAKK